MTISIPADNLLAMLPQVTEIQAKLELIALLEGLKTEFNQIEVIAVGETASGVALSAYVLAAVTTSNCEPESPTRLHIMATPDAVLSAGITWVAGTPQALHDVARLLNALINSIGKTLKLGAPARNTMTLPVAEVGNSYSDLSGVAWLLPKNREGRLSFSLHAKSSGWTLIATYGVVNGELLQA